jgi:hypothetical protein
MKSSLLCQLREALLEGADDTQHPCQINNGRWQNVHMNDAETGEQRKMETNEWKCFPKLFGIDIRLAGQPRTLYGNHYKRLKGSWYSHPQR